MRCFPPDALYGTRPLTAIKSAKPCSVMLPPVPSGRAEFHPRRRRAGAGHHPGAARLASDKRLIRRRRGNYHWLDTAAVRTHKLRGKRLIDRHVHRRPLNSTRHCRVTCPAEVLRIEQLEVDVPLGGHTLAVTCGVIGDAVSSLDFVGNAASRSRDRLVGGRQIIAKCRPGGETRLPRNRRSMVYAYVRLPEAGFDRKIGKLRKQGRRPEQHNGCSAQTHEVRVLPKLHQDPLPVPYLVQPQKSNTSLELCPARRGLLATPGSLKTELCPLGRLLTRNSPEGWKSLLMSALAMIHHLPCVCMQVRCSKLSSRNGPIHLIGLAK